jgi:hypothetical protein
MVKLEQNHLSANNFQVIRRRRRRAKSRRRRRRRRVASPSVSPVAIHLWLVNPKLFYGFCS